MLQDAYVLITNLRYLPGIFLPFRTQNSSSEFYPDVSGVRDAILQGVLFAVETLLLLSAIPVILVAPGAVSLTISTACFLLIYLLCKPFQGPKVRYSNMSKETHYQAEQHKDERWLFVNGCMVG